MSNTYRFVIKLNLINLIIFPKVMVHIWCIMGEFRRGKCAPLVYEEGQAPVRVRHLTNGLQAERGQRRSREDAAEVLHGVPVRACIY